MKNRSKHNKKKKKRRREKKKKQRHTLCVLLVLPQMVFPPLQSSKMAYVVFCSSLQLFFFSFTLKSRFPLLLLLSLRCYDIFSTRARPSECYTTLSNVPAFLSLSPSFTFIHSLRVTLLFFSSPSLSLSFVLFSVESR